MTTVLAADVGGTKTLLGLFRDGGELLHKERFDSAAFSNVTDMVTEFLSRPEVKQHPRPVRAALGVAGPVRDAGTGPDGTPQQRAQITNLPYAIETAALTQGCGLTRVGLYNDFYVIAAAVAQIASGAHDDSEIVALNPDAQADPRGAIAILGAGTGLGEALIARSGPAPVILPTEGGHTDFAPRDEVEIGLLRFMQRRHPDHVSVERVVCGAGLLALYEYLRESGAAPESPEVAEELQRASGSDDPAVVSKYGLTKKDALCALALERFVMLYGAEAGNLALKSLATGGVYLAGGIAAKILPAMTSGVFIEHFTRKGRFAPLLRRIPVYLLKSADIGLIGAARLAAQLK